MFPMIKKDLNTLFALLTRLCLLTALHTTAWAGDTASAPAKQRWTSSNGHFQLGYTSALEPITINRIHHWTLHLENAQGEPVANAEIQVQGGMPQHDHGLPTSPRLTEALGSGDYRLEGMRFHMPGYWELTLTIKAGSVTDTVLIPLKL